MRALALLAALGLLGGVADARFRPAKKHRRMFPSLVFKLPPGWIPPASQPAASAGESPPAPAPPAPALPRRTGVDLDEWFVRPARTTLGAGDVELNVVNFGEDPHDLTIDGYAQVALAPGASAQLLLTLPAGSYELYCSLEGHEQLGMTAQLLVKDD